MKKPVLVVMAAGMGSRYGGLKQLDPVGPAGEVIMDYSIYDARRAGFEKVIFIIKPSIDREFREKISSRIAGQMETAYAYQTLDDLPAGYSVPDGREKPWGTAHAILAARDLIDGPFAVINADDYYGPSCFRLIYDYLTSHHDDTHYRYCMAAYLLKNTVTVNGSVSRGVCVSDASGFLASVTEYTQIRQQSDRICYSADQGTTWQDIDGNTPVSMNLWGFSESFLQEAWNRFPAFLDQALQDNPLKGEYFLPGVVSQLLAEGRATVQILKTPDKWHGVTYREDKPDVMQALARMTEEGLYPSPLWK